jgi:hypothetical protein
LNLAIASVPCAIVLFGLILGFAGFGVNYFIRLVVYVLESRFANVMGDHKMQAGHGVSVGSSMDDSPSVATSHQPQSVRNSAELLASMVALRRLAFGCADIEDVSFGELFTTTHSIWLVTLVVALPPVIISITILGVGEVYHTCSGCSIFLEVFIGFALTLLVYILLSARILYVVWKLKFPDPQKLFAEFVGILILVGSTMALGALLLLFDPNNVGYQREFAFEWIIQISTFIYWYLSCGSQFLDIFRKWRKLRNFEEYRRVIQARRKTAAAFRSVNVAHPHHSSSVESLADYSDDYITIMNEDEQIKQEFEKFAISRYAVENLYFVNDVQAYKRFFFEKAANWRKQKATFLFETYIKPGSVMEVNISQQVKLQAIREIEANLHSEDSHLVLAFDKAAEDITNNVLRDIWQQFIKEKFVTSKSLTGDENLDALGEFNTSTENSGGRASLLSYFVLRARKSNLALGENGNTYPGRQASDLSNTGWGDASPAEV